MSIERMKEIERELIALGDCENPGRVERGSELVIEYLNLAADGCPLMLTRRRHTANAVRRGFYHVQHMNPIVRMRRGVLGEMAKPWPEKPLDEFVGAE